jgi:predicted transcriptional regulator
MKRQYLILSLLFILGILIIIISIFVAMQSLKEIPKREKESQLQTGLRQPQVSPLPLVNEQREEPAKTKEHKIKPKEEATDLSQIPDSVFEEARRRESPGSAPSLSEGKGTEEGGPRLNTQPSSRDLRELKSKGAVIY